MVNRGRYFCVEHGSFCDSSDNFAHSCPLCTNEDVCEWQPNKVDRALQIVKNIQNRSQRAVTMVTGLIGLLGAVSIFGPDAIGQDLLKLDSMTVAMLLFALILSLLSTAFYLLSMSHMGVVSSQGGLRSVAVFGLKDLAEWEKIVAGFLRRIERFHSVGNWLFVLAIVLLMFAFVWHEFISECLSAWQYKRMTS